MTAAGLVLAWVLLAHPDATMLDKVRFGAVADAIVLESARAPLQAGTQASQRLLGAIAEHEGHLREDVRRCSVTGDNDKAVTLFQLHPEALGTFTRGEACASDNVAARLALSALRAGEKMCHGDLRCAVRLYASGTKKETRAAKEIWSLFRRLR